MEWGSSKLESQRVRIDAREGRHGRRGIAEQEPEHSSWTHLEAMERHGGDEDLATGLEIPDHDSEPAAGGGHRDLIGLMHRLERGDMHSLPEPAGDAAVGLAAMRIEHVCRPLAPGSAGHLGDDALEYPVGVVQEEERDRVEADAEVARVRQ